MLRAVLAGNPRHGAFRRVGRGVQLSKLEVKRGNVEIQHARDLPVARRVCQGTRIQICLESFLIAVFGEAATAQIREEPHCQSAFACFERVVVALTRQNCSLIEVSSAKELFGLLERRGQR